MSSVISWKWSIHDLQALPGIVVGSAYHRGDSQVNCEQAADDERQPVHVQL